MKKSITKVIGVLALLCSSASMAYTVNVTPSAASSAVDGIDPGVAFYLTVSSPDMPETTGPTLKLHYDATRVQVTSVTFLAPFTFASWLAGGTPGTTDIITVLNTNVTLSPGPFDAFRINFTAKNTGPNLTSIGPANIVLIDDGGDFAWSDPDALPISPVTYNQANVYTGQVVPVPAAAWLLMSALGSIAGLKRLRRQ